VIPQGRTEARRRVQLLLFRLGSVLFGVPAEQVAGLRGYGEAGAGAEPPTWIHARLGFPEAPRYRDPTAALVPRADRPPAWVVLDSIDDLLEVELDAVRPFPALAEPHALRRGMWGILPSQGRLVLLVDLDQLLETE
jgi:chemotaxis signal transduction protein